MIAVDTSALMAMLLEEPDAATFEDEIGRHDRAVIGAATALEFHLVAYRKGGVEGRAIAESILSFPPFDIVPWTPDLVRTAADALHRFGGRPARLNYGDCMAYALARSLDVPLLFKGGDFAATDIRAALPQRSSE